MKSFNGSSDRLINDTGSTREKIPLIILINYPRKMKRLYPSRQSDRAIVTFRAKITSRLIDFDKSIIALSLIVLLAK
jgi:hypothetical protein